MKTKLLTACLAVALPVLLSSAAFMSLTNPGKSDIKLTSATSPAASMVQLHEMAMKDGKW